MHVERQVAERNARSQFQDGAIVQGHSSQVCHVTQVVGVSDVYSARSISAPSYFAGIPDSQWQALLLGDRPQTAQG